MRKTILTFFLTLGVTFFSFSQNDEFSTADLRKVASKVGFTGAKIMKNFSAEDLIQFYNKIEADRGLLKQININSWGVCDHYKIDNFDTYNYYYKDVTRETYNQYCKELNALMLIDGTITQLK